MEIMLTDLCQELHNYFIKEIIAGEFEINEDGTIDGLEDKLIEGQYYRIVGSVLNDGVHRFSDSGLQPEKFSGAIWAMAVPPAVVALASEIESWIANNKDMLDSPYTSESFGGYSYSKATDANGSLSWQSHFGSRLNKWRKLHV